MRLFRLVTGWAGALLMASILLGAPDLDFETWECLAASSPNQWQAPAGALAEQIAGVLGPGQATLIIRNVSSIDDSELPAIRTLVEKDLKAHGIAVASGESANTIRITLSQNDRGRLWVGEIIQGNETRVVMVAAGSDGAQTSATADYMTLRRERLPILRPGGIADDPVLGALESKDTLLMLRSYGIEMLAFGEGGWLSQKTIPLDDRRQSSRDPHGMLIPGSDGDSFSAFIGSSECSGAYAAAGTN